MQLTKTTTTCAFGNVAKEHFKIHSLIKI